MLLIRSCILTYCCNLRILLKDVSNSVLVYLASRKPALSKPVAGSVMMFSVGDITSLLLAKNCTYAWMLLVYTVILTKQMISAM